MSCNVCDVRSKNVNEMLGSAVEESGWEAGGIWVSKFVRVNIERMRAAKFIVNDSSGDWGGLKSLRAKWQAR